MNDRIKPLQRTPESLSYDNIRSRVGQLPEQYKPAEKYLLTHIYVKLDEILSVRTKIALLRTDPEEAKRQYRTLWEPLNLPEEVLKIDEPKPEDIPALEQQLAELKREEMDFLSRLTELEKGNPTQMLDLMLKARDSHRKGRAFGEEHGINILDSGVAEGSPVDAILDRTIEALRKKS